MNARLAIVGACVLSLFGWTVQRAAQAPSAGATRRPLLFLADEDHAPLSYVEDGATTGIDFTDPIIDHEFGFFVRTGEAKVNSFVDLSGRKVAVTVAGIPRRLLAASSNAQLVLVTNYSEGFAKLAAGEIDAVAADVWVGAYTLEQHGFKNIVRTGPVFATLSGSIAVAKGNEPLVAEINKALAVLRSGGTIDRIVAQWRPKEVVFVTRERMRAMAVLVIVVIVALVLLGAHAVWKQRSAQDRHRRAEERVHLLAQVVENAHDVIFTVDREGYCLSMNRAGQMKNRSFDPASRPQRARHGNPTSWIRKTLRAPWCRLRTIDRRRKSVRRWSAAASLSWITRRAPRPGASAIPACTCSSPSCTRSPSSWRQHCSVAAAR